MTQKNKRPPAVAAAGAAKGNVVSENTSTIAQTVAAANSPAITSVRRGPGGVVSGLKAEWLVTVAGVCIDAPMRDRALWRYSRFCNVMAHRYGVAFAPMKQSDWAVIVEAAIAEGDGTS